MTAPPKDALNELAPNGILRAAINFGNLVLAQKNSENGEPCGVSVDLARELARRLGVPIQLVLFDAAGKVFEAAQSHAWDIAFLAVDPVRAADILFTAPYVLIEGTYLVRDASPFHAIEEFDRPGVRIAVAKGAAYDLFLTRAIKHAEIIRHDTSSGAMELFLDGGLEAAAGVKQPLVEFARTHSGLRVIEGRYMSIEQAMGTPKGRPGAREFLQTFIEEMKRTGFVASALERSGQGGASVAPARDSWPKF
ncbi:MAG TPA: ABC transporter substrate-binding protein [Candidatus Acidoferrales bacterium]|jgi:polar amino acid transport system substrate-binding protein|nr:ABC transporter substrate-binding protein [Candidatus Acidoferrales bacterium]